MSSRRVVVYMPNRNGRAQLSHKEYVEREDEHDQREAERIHKIKRRRLRSAHRPAPNVCVKPTQGRVKPL